MCRTESVRAQGAGNRTDLDPAQRLKELKAAASAYRIEREGEPPIRLELVPEPALRWNNPLSIAYDGAVFVWVADGRPEVAACFYRNVWGGRAMEHHEFQSLSEARLTATSPRGVVWAPRAPGIVFKAVPDAPAPAADAPRRLRQARALARQFHAGYKSEDTPQRSSLRLLVKPLFQYAGRGPEQPEGVLFAFVKATDPEALLVIETRPTSAGPAWHYGFARMRAGGLRGWHNDPLVWEVSRTGPDPGSPYTEIWVPVPVD